MKILAMKILSITLFSLLALTTHLAASASPESAQTSTTTSSSQLSAALTVKVTELDLFDQKRQRPVKITLWYPAQENCQDAKICLSEQAVLNKALVFSHGAMGAAKGYSWIGKMFAAQGYVTVGINHYGESWVYGPEHINPAAVLQFWERPVDISFVLDVLQSNQLSEPVLSEAPELSKVSVPSTTSNPSATVTTANTPNSLGTVGNSTRIFNQTIAWDQIVAVGHSSGGATILSMAGSKQDFNHAATYCATAAAAEDRSCHYLKFQTAANTKGYNPAQSFVDHRIKRIIALDPALGHATTAESLQAMTIPVLVIGSSQNDFLPYPRHAGYYADTIPAASRLVFSEGEGHFVYLDRCTHQYQAMGVALCVDRPGIDRTQVQQKAGAVMLAFIN